MNLLRQKSRIRSAWTHEPRGVLLPKAASGTAMETEKPPREGRAEHQPRAPRERGRQPWTPVECPRCTHDPQMAQRLRTSKAVFRRARKDTTFRRNQGDPGQPTTPEAQRRSRDRESKVSHEAVLTAGSLGVPELGPQVCSRRGPRRQPERGAKSLQSLVRNPSTARRGRAPGPRSPHTSSAQRGPKTWT